MIVSLGEVDAMLRKAARGAGWPWGHAEELGASARALCGSGLPGVALGAALLNAAADDTHCPIRFAARCGDARQLPPTDTALCCPLLAMPLLATVFCSETRALQARWGSHAVTVDVHGHTQLKASDSHNGIDLVAIGLTLVPATQPRNHTPVECGVNVRDSDWQALDAHAQHSYVPASEQSRQGAGPAD